MESQCHQIIELLRQGPITPQDALQKVGCFRLAARIHELRKAGYDIQQVMKQRNGKHFAEYHLKEE